MSTGTYSLLKVVVAGDVITAADRNAEHQNHIDNAEPDGIGCHSDNLAEMRQTTDPYPAGSPSLATELAGELERLRYLIAQITGETYWYIDPDTTLAALAASAAAYLPGTSGTKTWFYQDSAPTGWTLDSTPADSLLAVKGGTGLYNINGGNQAGGWAQTPHYHPPHKHGAGTVTVDFLGSAGGGTSGGYGYLPNVQSIICIGETANGGGSGYEASAPNTDRPLAQVGIICEMD